MEDADKIQEHVRLVLLFKVKDYIAKSFNKYLKFDEMFSICKDDDDEQPKNDRTYFQPDDDSGGFSLLPQQNGTERPDRMARIHAFLHVMCACFECERVLKYEDPTLKEALELFSRASENFGRFRSIYWLLETGEDPACADLIIDTNICTEKNTDPNFPEAWAVRALVPKLSAKKASLKNKKKSAERKVAFIAEIERLARKNDLWGKHSRSRVATLLQQREKTLEDVSHRKIDDALKSAGHPKNRSGGKNK